jgi:uncharacterized caspase-like protein
VNDHDHAIVIGIGRYADAGNPPPWITNLEGPDNDAEAIAEWLRDARGGGLPYGNVHVVRSADFPPPGNPGPVQQAVIDALDSVESLPENAYGGQYAGRRFYLYVAGHGWASKRNETALVTAEATRATPLNVLASGWMEWLWNADRFRELVLWVDACATRTAASVPRRCMLADRYATAPDAKRFDAFAAKFNLTSVEAEMPDHRWHGAFTYALLQGLNGAVPGAVTATSLHDYLVNNMKSFMRDDQRIAATVSHEPDFGRVDDIAFPTRSSKFALTLRFRNDCVGKRAVVVTNSTLPPAADTVLTTTDWQPKLQAGHYVASVPDLGLLSVFTVTGGGADDGVVISVP